MSYGSSDTPQEIAGRVSGANRTRRAAERRAREARHKRLRDHPGLPDHPWICVCDGCEALRPPEPDEQEQPQ